MRTRPVEPLVWLLFSAGGVITALLVPVLLFLFALAFPLGWIAPPGHDHLLAVIGHPLSRIVLLGLCILGLFHWAHRFRYTLHDGLQLKRLGRQIGVACYGAALVGSAAACYILLIAL
jgi:fumarate reductase subunit D